MKAKNAGRRPKNSIPGTAIALRQAALAARKIARMHGTPVYFWRDGKVVAEKP